MTLVKGSLDAPKEFTSHRFENHCPIDFLDAEWNIRKALAKTTDIRILVLIPPITLHRQRFEVLRSACPPFEICDSQSWIRLYTKELIYDTQACLILYWTKVQCTFWGLSCSTTKHVCTQSTAISMPLSSTVHGSKGWFKTTYKRSRETFYFVFQIQD